MSEVGMVSILKEESKTNISTTYKKIIDINSSLNLPYAWEMGKPCTKKVAEQLLKDYDYLLK